MRAFAAHLPVVMASCNLVIFLVLSIMEWRVHPTWLIAAIFVLNVVIVTTLRFFLKFHFGSETTLRCYVILILAGAVNFSISLGPLPAALATFPICAVLYVCRILLRVPFAEKIQFAPRLAARLLVTLSLVYFVPVANLMSDHTLLGTVDVECGNDRCVRSLSPGSVYEVNAQRYRGPIAATRPDGADPRLMFLGDSSTFGFGLKQKDTYPALTRDMLRRRGWPNAEVLNAAVPGHTEIENLQRLRKYESWCPTHVFVMGGWHYRNLSRPVGESELLAKMRPVRGAAFLLALMTHRMFHADPEPQSESLRLWTIALGDLVARIRKTGATPVLLEYPAPDTDPEVLATEAQLAELKNVSLIRLKDMFAASAESPLLFDRCHPNDVGHRLIAEAVVEWFSASEPSTLPGASR